jgi:adenosylmethionine-8-amino-7-oxononanoate aminotransferase
MLGPPLVVTDPEVDELVELTAQSVEAATAR